MESSLPISSRELIEALRDGAFITDAHGTIIAANRAFSRTSGYSQQEILGKMPRMFKSEPHDRMYDSRVWLSLRRHGTWQGEILSKRKSGDVVPEWLTISTIRNPHEGTFYYLAVFRDITRHKRAEESLKRLAHYDALTGLPNRRLFNEYFHRAIASCSRDRLIAILFLDLDRFKEINDQLGHAAGDRVLAAVGARLTGCLRRTDTVARWAGDEFVLLLDPVSGPEDVVRIARKILRVLRRPFTVHGHRAQATASIGGCVLDRSSSAGQLLEKADQAMYAAKRRGRDAVEILS